MKDEIDGFANTMRLKAEKVMKEKGYSSHPWDLPEHFLQERLMGELREYTENYDVNELIDIANLCCFLWWKWWLNALEEAEKD